MRKYFGIIFGIILGIILVAVLATILFISGAMYLTITPTTTTVVSATLTTAIPATTPELDKIYILTDFPNRGEKAIVEWRGKKKGELVVLTSHPFAVFVERGDRNHLVVLARRASKYAAPAANTTDPLVKTKRVEVAAVATSTLSEVNLSFVDNGIEWVRSAKVVDLTGLSWHGADGGCPEQFKKALINTEGLRNNAEAVAVAKAMAIKMKK